MRSLPRWIVLAASLLVGCDPSFAVVLDNRAANPVIVARWTDRDRVAPTNVVEVPADSRATLGSFGVASTEVLERITILDVRCAVLSDELLGEEFIDGGSITVDDSLNVVFLAGGNPPRGDSPRETDSCRDVIESLPPTE